MDPEIDVTEDLRQTVIRARAKAMSDSQRELLDKVAARQSIPTDEEVGTELEPLVIEGEIVDENELAPIETANLPAIDPDDPAVDVAYFDKEVIEILEEMPVVGRHGHLRVASSETADDLVRTVETLEANLKRKKKNQ